MSPNHFTFRKDIILGVCFGNGKLMCITIYCLIYEVHRIKINLLQVNVCMYMCTTLIDFGTFQYEIKDKYLSIL